MKMKSVIYSNCVLIICYNSYSNTVLKIRPLFSSAPAPSKKETASGSRFYKLLLPAPTPAHSKKAPENRF